MPGVDRECITHYACDCLQAKIKRLGAEVTQLTQLLETCREALRMGIQSPYEARSALLARLDEQLEKKYS